jgi:hypothetical protein
MMSKSRVTSRESRGKSIVLDLTCGFLPEPPETVIFTVSVRDSRLVTRDS